MDSNDSSTDSSKSTLYNVDVSSDRSQWFDQKYVADISEADLDLLFQSSLEYSLDQAVEVLTFAVDHHKDDPAVSPNLINFLQDLSHDKERAPELRFYACLLYDWSIYPEVRSCTRPFAEPEQLEETWRVYVLGILWSCAGSALATFFANRFPSISLGASALQILIMLSGKLLARLPSLCIGKWQINPGKWTFKEQMLTTLTMSVSVGCPYSMLAIVAQSNSEFYNTPGASVGYMLILTFSSQFMGFGIAGLMRRFLVYPVKCIWYSVLPSITLNRSLIVDEPRTTTDGWSLTRFEIFQIFGAVSFAWYVVTNFLFIGLGYFDWMAWIKPNNVNLQAVTGCLSGLAINPISTFDWNVIDQGGMVAPLFATVNQFAGVIISTVAILVIWYTNTCWTSYFPINSNVLFDNKGKKYSVAKVVDNKGLLNLEKLRRYSLPFYSAGNLINYAVNFMIYPAMFVYAGLNYHATIWDSLREFCVALKGSGAIRNNDRFSRAQRKYPEVPEYWFLIILFASLGLAIATVEHYKFTNTPVWTIFFGVGLATIFTVPFGILYSRTNLSLDINVLFELIIGYAMPGNGMGLMVSKVYATNFMAQTDNYITNQVQAHYTGLAPRSLFRLQILSVICNTFVQTGIIYWQVNGGISDLCDIENKEKFTCQGVRTYFNASVIWGVIGPQRIFDHVYPYIKWCFLIGAVYPVVFWLARKRFPRLSSVNEMVILSGCQCWSPTNWMYLLPNLYVGLFFNGWVKRKHLRWWTRYNYILNAALRVGVAYAGLILFFGTEYKHKASIDWWGNSVPFETLDAKNHAVLLELPDQGYFGPDMSQLQLK